MDDRARFKVLILPHLEAAYNLARWITGNDSDAADVLQESCLRAFRFINTLKSNESRPWFFQIVRNFSYSWIKQRTKFIAIDEEIQIVDQTESAESILVRNVNTKALHAAIEELPTEYREVLILRELEELSYSEIVQILSIPEGTLMSRLSRARSQLRKILFAQSEGGIREKLK